MGYSRRASRGVRARRPHETWFELLVTVAWHVDALAKDGISHATPRHRSVHKTLLFSHNAEVRGEAR